MYRFNFALYLIINSFCSKQEVHLNGDVTKESFTQLPFHPEMHVDELVCCSLGKTVSTEQPHHVRSKISTGLYTAIKMTSTWYLRGKFNIFLLDNFLYGKFSSLLIILIFNNDHWTTILKLQYLFFFLSYHHLWSLQVQQI